ncbi:MAG: class I SAM-dependent DNA methyltransferase [Halofilum sp. (in: g-proteobacteria)]
MTDSSLDYLEKVYSSDSLDDLRDSYAAWAMQYDRDVMSMGYQTPGLIAGMFGRHVQRDETPILDCGAGTGLLGLLLAGLGHRGIAAMDMSEQMLAVARARGCYDDIRTGVLGEPLDYPDDHFSAIVAGGVFTLGHAPANAYEEIARILRPGGHFLVSEQVDNDANADYRTQRESLEGRGSGTSSSTASASRPFRSSRPKPMCATLSMCIASESGNGHDSASREQGTSGAR